MIERVRSISEDTDDSLVSRLLRSASSGRDIAHSLSSFRARDQDSSSAVPSTVNSDDIENPVQQSSQGSGYIAQTRNS